MKYKYMTASICIAAAVTIIGFVIYMGYMYIKKYHQKEKANILFCAVDYIYECLILRFNVSMNMDRMERLRKINVGADDKEITKRYYTKIITIFICILLCVSIMVPVVILSSEAKDIIYSNYFIEKDKTGGTDKEVNIRTRIADKEKEVRINVPARVYSDDELKRKLKEAKKYINDRFLASNKSKDNITADLNFVQAVPDSEIIVNWAGDAEGYIDDDGKVSLGGLEEPKQVEVSATLQYLEDTEDIIYQLTVNPPKKNSEESVWDLWEKTLKILTDRTTSQKYLQLPSEISGYKVSYRENEDYSYIYVFLLGVFCIILVPFVLESRTKASIENRDKELRRDYPELVEKFILLIGAGLNVKGAWLRITNEYIGKREKDGTKLYAYEEMLVTRYQIENGMTELKAYELFGRRIGLLPYMKFSTLLTQNLRKGTSDMLRILEYEAIDIMNEKKENAKILGEEASTKLLLPMMLMMLEVFAIIIYAAFQSM